MLHRTLRSPRATTAAAVAVAGAASRSIFTIPSYRHYAEGPIDSKEWRVYFKSPQTDAVVSPWHDLPLRPAVSISSSSSGAAASALVTDPRLFVGITEIPKGTRAKLELCKEEAYNPIKQDVVKKKAGQPLRYFMYGDIPFNYGFLPQTWEDPGHVDARTGCKGDADPIDMIHLGPAHTIGQYAVVRVLGVLGLIDQGETDWKIIVEAASPETQDSSYGDVSNVPSDVLATIADWFENYKVPEGKAKNTFAFNREVRGAETALEIIAECASHYELLMAGKCPGHEDYWLR